MAEPKNFIAAWAKKINWKDRVKAICKPCWELKYCPYGPLVEDFPLTQENDEKSCRIFGHNCPVFYVAEPFTETKELRRITRSIPRTVQFKVLKRENQICDKCSQSVRDADIEFDHIIPWSKGGPTEEHNIRLLCSSCNRKRGNRFETEYLVNNLNEHLAEPDSVDTIGVLIQAVAYGHEIVEEKDQFPTAQDYANKFTEGEVSIFEERMSEIYSELYEFFTTKKPEELKVKEYSFLKDRWGFETHEMYFLKDLCVEYNFDIQDGVAIERTLMNRLGFNIKNRKSDFNKWSKF